MIPPSLRRNPLCFVDDLVVPVLADEDRRHLTASLRLGAGDPVNLSDGTGAWVEARLTDDGGSVEVTGRLQREERSGPVATVGFAPTKGVKPEWIVQKLTEVGLDRIGLLRTERSVVQYRADRAERLMSRLERVVRAASSQSRRPRVPVLLGMLDLGDFVSIEGCSYLADPDGSRWSDVVCPADSPRSLAVGPEGGWSPAERDLAPRVRLPGRILRADTAAVAAGLVLMD